MADITIIPKLLASSTKSSKLTFPSKLASPGMAATSRSSVAPGTSASDRLSLTEAPLMVLYFPVEEANEING